MIRLRKSSPQQFNLEYRGILIGSLSRDGLRALLDVEATVVNPVLKPKINGKKKLSKHNIEKNELLSKAKQFGRAYRLLRAATYRTGKSKISDVAFTATELGHFVKAIKIMQRVGCKSYKLFIKAQIEGLKFLDNGKGIFPRPFNLSTDAAETRFLEYLRSVHDENGDIIRLQISDDERNTPLAGNSQYQAARDRIREGIASREDVVYVYELQLIRNKKVEQYVLDYIDELNADS